MEKLRIASKLDEIGLDYIEAGSAITSEGERKSIKEITSQGFNAEILSFSRPLTVDIDYCIDMTFYATYKYTIILMKNGEPANTCVSFLIV